MIVLIPITLLYGVFSIAGIFLIWGGQKSNISKELPEGVSVVIAARNEAERIRQLLVQILKNKTPFPIEVIVVDDSSTDDTLKFLNEIQDERLIVIQSKGEGKKEAIAEAVQAAKYEAVVQTDADCEVGEYWLMSMINQLMGGHNLVVGPVYPIQSRGLLNGLIRLDWLGLQYLTAFTTRLKKPGMLNGANMAFWRKDYLGFVQSKLGEQYASGDDMFFLNFLSKRGRATFNLDKSAIVKTEMPSNLSELIQQRVRWATKSSKTTNAPTYFFSLIIAMANFGWIAGLISFLNDFRDLPILLIAAGWKLTSDFIICWNMAKFNDDTKVLTLLPVMFFIFPVYLLLGFFLLFKKSYSWKGRTTA